MQTNPATFMWFPSALRRRRYSKRGKVDWFQQPPPS
jgi:hypothetical protein